MVDGLVLAGLVLVAGTLTWTSWVGPAVLAVLSVLWLVVNGPMEGPTLLVLDQEHGLTAGDLAGLAGLVVAALRAVSLLMWRSRYRLPRR